MQQTIVLDEHDRQKLLDLRCKQDSLEMFIAGGSSNVTEEHMSDYYDVLHEINEFKREQLLDMGEINEAMYDFVFYFDTVAGFVVVEDADE